MQMPYTDPTTEPCKRVQVKSLHSSDIAWYIGEWAGAETFRFRTCGFRGLGCWDFVLMGLYAGGLGLEVYGLGVAVWEWDKGL